MNLNFYCIGSSKCGTSSLHDILNQHPDIFLPTVKETKFLSKNHEKGVEWYYNEYFKKYNNEKAVGEIYPCLALQEAPKRLFESFGKDLKIIVVLRNPVARMYSNYLGQMRIGKIKIPFREVIKNNSMILENSLYAKHLIRFFEVYPKENFKIFLFEEDFIKNRKQMITTLCEFLEVDQFDFNLDVKSNSTWKPKSEIINRIIYKRPKAVTSFLNQFFKSKELKQRIRIRLSELNSRTVKSEHLELKEQAEIYNKYFKEDVIKLENLIEKDLSFWYTPYLSNEK